MTPLLPILPVLLLALFCAIAGFWSLRAIDRFLAEPSAPAHPSQSQTGSDTHLRIPH